MKALNCRGWLSPEVAHVGSINRAEYLLTTFTYLSREIWERR